MRDIHKGCLVSAFPGFDFIGVNKFLLTEKLNERYGTSGLCSVLQRFRN